MTDGADAHAYLDEALAHLAGRPFKVIGGHALTAYGVPRTTVDVDLLVEDRGILRDVFAENPDLEVRAATEPTDPLDGVVEWWPEDGDARVPVRIIVLARRWLAPLFALPGVPMLLGGRVLEAVAPVAFIALKVYAGGPRDRADVELLASLPGWPAWKADFEARLPLMPPMIQRRWARWRPGEADDDLG